jgi:LPS O-antigen subunit length determinant protein (WzzB/FepE family)
MLAIINAVLVFILSIIVALNVYYVLKLQYTQATIRDELEKKVLQAINTMDLMDLKEFKDLEPNTKKFYKEYISGAIMPLVIKHFNVILTTSKEYNQLVDKKTMDDFMTNLSKELETATVQFIHTAQSS